MSIKSSTFRRPRFGIKASARTMKPSLSSSSLSAFSSNINTERVKMDQGDNNQLDEEEMPQVEHLEVTPQLFQIDATPQNVYQHVMSTPQGRSHFISFLAWYRPEYVPLVHIHEQGHTYRRLGQLQEWQQAEKIVRQVHVEYGKVLADIFPWMRCQEENLLEICIETIDAKFHQDNILDEFYRSLEYISYLEKTLNIQQQQHEQKGIRKNATTSEAASISAVGSHTSGFLAYLGSECYGWFKCKKFGGLLAKKPRWKLRYAQTFGDALVIHSNPEFKGHKQDSKRLILSLIHAKLAYCFDAEEKHCMQLDILVWAKGSSHVCHMEEKRLLLCTSNQVSLSIWRTALLRKIEKMTRNFQNDVNMTSKQNNYSNVQFQQSLKQCFEKNTLANIGLYQRYPDLRADKVSDALTTATSSTRSFEIGPENEPSACVSRTYQGLAEYFNISENRVYRYAYAVRMCIFLGCACWTAHTNSSKGWILGFAGLWSYWDYSLGDAVAMETHPWKIAVLCTAYVLTQYLHWFVCLTALALVTAGMSHHAATVRKWTGIRSQQLKQQQRPSGTPGFAFKSKAGNSDTASSSSASSSGSAGSSSSSSMGMHESTESNPAHRKRVVTDVAWINFVLDHLWANLKFAIEETLREYCKWVLQDENLPSFISSIVVNQLEFGHAPMVERVYVHNMHTETQSSNAIVLDVDCNWYDTPQIILDVNMKGGVSTQMKLQELHIRGCLRIEFILDGWENDRPKWPCFSALKYGFVYKPQLHFRFKALKVDVMNVPLVSDWLHSSVSDLIENYFTYPNCIVAPDWRCTTKSRNLLPTSTSSSSTVDAVERQQLHLPIPVAVLGLKILALIPDVDGGGSSSNGHSRVFSSSIYCDFRVEGKLRSQHYRSHPLGSMAATCKTEQQQPQQQQQQQQFFFLIDDPETQSLAIKLLDEKMWGKDAVVAHALKPMAHFEAERGGELTVSLRATAAARTGWGSSSAPSFLPPGTAAARLVLEFTYRRLGKKLPPPSLPLGLGAPPPGGAVATGTAAEGTANATGDPWPGGRKVPRAAAATLTTGGGGHGVLILKVLKGVNLGGPSASTRAGAYVALTLLRRASSPPRNQDDENDDENDGRGRGQGRAGGERGSTTRTRVVRNGVNPVWNQVFYFIVDEPMAQSLHLQVFHTAAPVENTASMWPQISGGRPSVPPEGVSQMTLPLGFVVAHARDQVQQYAFDDDALGQSLMIPVGQRDGRAPAQPHLLSQGRVSGALHLQTIWRSFTG